MPGVRFNLRIIGERGAVDYVSWRVAPARCPEAGGLQLLRTSQAWESEPYACQSLFRARYLRRTVPPKLPGPWPERRLTERCPREYAFESSSRHTPDRRSLRGCRRASVPSASLPSVIL